VGDESPKLGGATTTNNAAAAQWLSLGNDVDVVIGDTLYSVREN